MVNYFGKSPSFGAFLSVFESKFKAHFFRIKAPLLTLDQSSKSWGVILYHGNKENFWQAAVCIY